MIFFFVFILVATIFTSLLKSTGIVLRQQVALACLFPIDSSSRAEEQPFTANDIESISCTDALLHKIDQETIHTVLSAFELTRLVPSAHLQDWWSVLDSKEESPAAADTVISKWQSLESLSAKIFGPNNSIQAACMLKAAVLKYHDHGRCDAFNR